MSHLPATPCTLEYIRQSLTRPLPGQAAQEKMAPQPTHDLVRQWQPPASYREASVLLLLYPHTANSHQPEWYTILTRRGEYPGVHSGQVSFPGGQREGQESLQTTALREAREEIGLAIEKLELVGQLSPLYIPPSNFYIYPFIACSPTRPTFCPNVQEVAELIETPLRLLQNPTTRHEEMWTFADGSLRCVPFFNIFGHRVWGATAMMLNEFLTLLI